MPIAESAGSREGYPYGGPGIYHLSLGLVGANHCGCPFLMADRDGVGCPEHLMGWVSLFRLWNEISRLM